MGCYKAYILYTGTMYIIFSSPPPSILPEFLILFHYLHIQNHTHIVSPVIDILNKDTMDYTTASPNVRGGFGPTLHFKWDSLSQTVQRTRKSHIEPIK